MSRELIAAVLRLKYYTPLKQTSCGFHRKPRWVPVAKSRIYYIPPRPQVPEEEKLELKRLADNYHTQMRALRKYYHLEMLKDKQSQLDVTSEQYLQQESLDFQRCIEINNEWNAERAKDREERRQKELELMQKGALATMVRKDSMKIKEIEKANQIIKKMKEDSETFITADNLDTAIEHALANPVDYNFSIDLDGNKYYGREANSSFEKKKEAVN